MACSPQSTALARPRSLIEMHSGKNDWARFTGKRRERCCVASQKETHGAAEKMCNFWKKCRSNDYARTIETTNRTCMPLRFSSENRWNGPEKTRKHEITQIVLCQLFGCALTLFVSVHYCLFLYGRRWRRCRRVRKPARSVLPFPWKLSRCRIWIDTTENVIAYSRRKYDRLWYNERMCCTPSTKRTTDTKIPQTLMKKSLTEYTKIEKHLAIGSINVSPLFYGSNKMKKQKQHHAQRMFLHSRHFVVCVWLVRSVR